MIIKGDAAGSVAFWSKHLMRDDTNTRAEVVEISGLLAEDLPSALKEMESIADQSRCRGNFMYQANINPREDEHLTPEQWKEAVDTLEKNLGLEGHQRVVVEHEKDGRIHRHVVWNRVDVETLRVTDIGGNYYTHERTARELEKRFGLEPTQSLHGERREEGRPERTPELWEQRAASRSHIDPKQLKAELTELWRNTDCGLAFAAALEERGYILAKGDRRDFCIVDHAGDAHSLARRIEGVRAKDVRERMADIDRDALPTVSEARERQHARFPDHDLAFRAWEERQPAAHDRAGDTTFPDGVSDTIESERGDRQDEALAESLEDWETKAEIDRARVDPIDPTDITKPALFVADAAAGGATSLADFVGRLFDDATKPQLSPAAVDQIEKIKEMRRAAAALESIRDSIERGERLQPSDIMNLPQNHLDNIKAKGDDYLRQLIEGMQRDRELEAEYGRYRER